jgi:hypothetical protein
MTYVMATVVKSVNFIREFVALLEETKKMNTVK